MHLPRVERLFALALSALAIAGCATLQVNSYLERGADFAQYRTYDWGPAPSRPTGDPRLDDNPFFRDHLQGAVDEQLVSRGFERTTSGTPDLLVYYHTIIQQGLDATSVDRNYECEECRPYVYEAGTLMLDLVDTRSHRVVWRGWARGAVDGVIDNQDWMEQKIDDAVRRIMTRLPHPYKAKELS